MGCFSFKCVECGDGIESSSFSGQNVSLYLLKAGKVIDEMHGPYNSYGRVFINGTREDGRKDLRQSREWKLDWSKVCDLMFREKINTGIAAVHRKCFKSVPKTVSARDPNQGWGGTKWDRKLGKYDNVENIKYDRVREKLWRAKHDLDFSGLMMVNFKKSPKGLQDELSEYECSKILAIETKIKHYEKTLKKLSKYGGA
jgi:hypothetical protein